jgi:hypothetical protein
MTSPTPSEPSLASWMREAGLIRVDGKMQSRDRRSYRRSPEWSREVNEALNDLTCGVLGGALVVVLLRIEWSWPRFQRIREAWYTMFGHRRALWCVLPAFVLSFSPSVKPCVRCGEPLPTFERAALRGEAE